MALLKFSGLKLIRLIELIFFQIIFEVRTRKNYEYRLLLMFQDTSEKRPNGLISSSSGLMITFTSFH